MKHDVFNIIGYGILVLVAGCVICFYGTIFWFNGGKQVAEDVAYHSRYLTDNKAYMLERQSENISQYEAGTKAPPGWRLDTWILFQTEHPYDAREYLRNLSVKNTGDTP